MSAVAMQQVGPSSLRRRSGQGSGALRDLEGKQEEAKTQRGRSRQSFEGEKEERLEKIWLRVTLKCGKHRGGTEDHVRRRRKRRRAICLRERFDNNNTDGTSCHKQNHT